MKIDCEAAMISADIVMLAFSVIAESGMKSVLPIAK